MTDEAFVCQEDSYALCLNCIKEKSDSFKGNRKQLAQREDWPVMRTRNSKIYRKNESLINKE
jgi:hypothetical protein